jgi:hypothetical protein
MAAEDCRRQARRCAVLASGAADANLKDALALMAQTWMKLALELEKAEALVGDAEPASS